MVKRNAIHIKDPVLKRKSNQRDKILNVAKVLFRNNGYSETSLDDIAQAARINRAIIYYHFKKKSDIIYEIAENNLKTLIDRSVPIVNSRLSPEDKLAKFILMHLKFELSPAGAHGIAQIKRFLPSGNYRDYVAMRDQYESNFRQIFNQICANEAEARLVCRLAFGLLTSIRTWYRPKGSLSIAQIAEAVYVLLMNGIKCKISNQASGQSPESVSCKKERRVMSRLPG